MANLTADGPVRSFTTSNAPPPNQPPVVSLTSPGDGASFAVGAPIAITATASDADGSIARVDFYAGDTLLASDTAAPYAFTWSGAAPGTYTIDAVAADDKGATTASTAVTISVTNAPPTITYYVAGEQRPLHRGTTLQLAASASDPDAGIARVRFFAGATLLGESTTAPYGYTWTNIPAGEYALTAVAVDTAWAPAPRPRR